MTHWTMACNTPRVREVEPHQFTPWGSYVVLPVPEWFVLYRVCQIHKGTLWYLVHMNDGGETEVEWTRDPREATLFDKEGAINESAHYEARYMEAA